MEPTTNPESRPFAAPCRDLSPDQPLRWIAAGWSDFRRSLKVSLVYGVAIAAVSLGVSALAWVMGRYVLVLAMLSGFVFVAPMLAVGLYSVSRQVGRGERPALRRSLSRMRKVLGNAMVFALVLLIIFLVWARAASMVHIFFPAVEKDGWFGLIRFLAIGSAVGSLFAAASFSAAAFSLPMIVDRDIDMVSAIVTSVNAVLRNKWTMAVWAMLIVVMTALGFATLGIGLVVVVPVLGYATWHGYEAAIDASGWPESPL